MADESVPIMAFEPVSLETGFDLIHKTMLSSTEDQVYVSQLALSSTQELLSASGSDGTIRCYKYDCFTPVIKLKCHSQNITGMEFLHNQPQVLWAASSTCLSCWDIRTGSTSPIKALESPNSSHLTCCSVNCSSDTIAAGSEKLDDDACIFLWDVRKADFPLMTIKDSHEDDITQVTFHPSKTHEMVSGSTDGLSCVFDISKESEDEALLSVLNSGSSVSQIGFCGNKQDQLFCITHIETLQLWNVFEASLQHDFGDFRENFSNLESLDYLVTCFCNGEGQDLYLIGGSQRGSMQLFQVMENKLERKCLLRGGHSAPVRCCLWDGKRLTSGGEDSIVCSWAPDSASGSPKHTYASGKVLSGAMDKLKVHGKKPYEKHRRKKRK